MKKTDWAEKNRVLIACIGIGSVITLLIILNRVIPDLMGFNSDFTVNKEKVAGKVVKKIVIGQSAKTFWDWLGLLGVPVVLAGLGYWYQDREKSFERTRQEQLEAISKGTRQDEILKNYFESMTELLLDKGLRDSENEDDEIRTVARILTLTVLRQLDNTRNNLVVQFLREARLIYVKEFIPGQEVKFEGNSRSTILSLASAHLSGADLNRVNLSGADLKRTDFSEADLGNVRFRETSLRGANLSYTNLRSADLRDSDLEYTDFSGADLGGADLAGANLCLANLNGANLSGAILSGADLSSASLRSASLSGAYLVDANLSDAYLVNANLRGADLRNVNLSNARYDDKTTLPSGFDPKLNGMVKAIIFEDL